MDGASALVVGYGSIGSRHAEVLARMGCRVAVVSSREGVAEDRYPDIASAVAGADPDYVVVAVPTARHAEALATLAATGYSGPVLVEKPLFEAVVPMPDNAFEAVYVGYNLRFHPVIAALRGVLDGSAALSVQAYVGQYLPDWRAGRDYRESYSASAAAGGGALRDLSHEMDLVLWLFGGWLRIAALGGHFSSLETDADDVYGLLMEQELCPVTLVQMNCLDRAAHRRLTIVTDGASYEADLLAGTLATEGDTMALDVDRDETFAAEHRAVLERDASVLCTAEDGLGVVRAIAAAESASARGEWVAS